AGGVAHDFNNLLTSIIGYADFLIESLDPHSPQYQDAVGIKRVAERAASLTRQLLAFSRRQVLRPQVLNLNAVVTNTLKMLGRLVGEDIELVSKLCPELGKVKVDPTQIDQVLMNLAVNAREAMPNGGRLTIETANVLLTADDARKDAEITPGAYVALIVSDTGVGVATEVLPRLFDPFFTTKEMGSGLGLATVYGIVKQSGGHIQVFSERGKGTTFTVYLPSVAEEVAEKAWREADTPSAGGSETVLVVEDDEAVRTMLARALQRYGYDVLEATSGEEALRLCQNMEKPPDLLVTDVVMPGQLNGRQLVARLGTLYPALKVVYISGYMDVTSADEGNLEPGAVFLQKPFTPTTLAKKVRQALDG
ncbi:MAG: response regulator, partial [Planctomycetes bacterium]|nr:response regulator [Planctomycetota bacterium]